MENPEQFYDERAALNVAADYKRKGFQVDFIPESVTKQPDFQVINPAAARFPCLFEVKHISGREAVDALRQEVRAVVSPYIANVYVGYLQLATQAKNIGLEIAAEIGELAKNLATPTTDKPYRKRIFDCECEIYLKQSGKAGPTTVGVHWSSRETFKQTSSTLSRIIDGARDQLSSYMPSGVNIILLDVDRATLQGDEVYDVLYSKDLPGLFTLDTYKCVSALKFVSHVIPPRVKLFTNQKNSHVKSGVLATLGL
jgi:hypothetical protein